MKLCRASGRYLTGVYHGYHSFRRILSSLPSPSPHLLRLLHHHRPATDSASALSHTCQTPRHAAALRNVVPPAVPKLVWSNILLCCLIFMFFESNPTLCLKDWGR
ncbi:hypothetical protein EX30DRAFT_127239 [Ascodesmis nigricans]|uniref:Uncharacterized protein n=1 Tax=Ascodesmis nigricans TaxID=341454 RepID=A0A4S2MNT6_9PEZI|nr:hypothetical protein EX30DRAFT_127239 [Ascodesmis nigricans]